jgi:hypothetical protein
MNIFQTYLSYGLSVIPCNTDKTPAISWQQYQSKRANGEAESWTGQIACVCGDVSGGLVAVDFDIKNGNKWDEWLKLINEQYPELLSKLVVEKTPSGGFHVIFRTDKVIRNIKLAKNKENKATIETRGSGGYFLCAPSIGYTLEFSDFSNIQKLTNEESEIIFSTCSSLNEFIVDPVIPAYERQAAAPRSTESAGDISPFDDYNSRHDIVGLLQKHGWRLLFNRGDKSYFQRPDKEGRGISASWNAVPDRFYVFSTSTNFENEHIYKASAVYAMLVHAGDFRAAAKQLYADGYGLKSSNPLTILKPKAKLLEINDMAAQLINVYKNGYPKGKTTGWKSFDKLYSVIKGQFTVVTGYPSSGKSEWVDALLVNLSQSEKWKFAVFSPENYPSKIHYHKLVEKIIGKPMNANMKNCCTIEEIKTAEKYISEHFYFIDATEDEIDLDAIFKECQILIDTKKIDGIYLDPWNEIELDKPRDISTTEYIGKCLRMSRKFARRNNVHLWIVVHPTKPIRNKNNELPIPDLYSCEGSAHWRNKADNGICVHRDYDDNSVLILVQKIKYKFTGEIGEQWFEYDKNNGQYNETNKTKKAKSWFLE